MVISLKKKFICLLALIAALLVLSGCAATNSLFGGNSPKDAMAEVDSPVGASSSKDATAEMVWGYASNQVVIDIHPSLRLNEYDGQPHTLVIGVFQMADAGLFYKLTSDSSAMGSALETGKGGELFLQLLRFVVSPGKCTRIMLDRVQHTKYVGVITGYYSIDQKNSSRLFPVQYSISSKGLIFKTYSAKPQKLTIKMDLGAQAIVNAESVDGDGVDSTSVAQCPDGNSPNSGIDKQPECCNYTLLNIQDKLID